MAQLGGEILGYVQRYQALQAQRDTFEDLFKDLLLYAKGLESNLETTRQRLTAELNEAKLDLEDARQTRRDFQQRLQEAESARDYYSQGVGMFRNRNQYIVVLIDGDGLLFKESFVNQGIEGGKKAANALRAAILSQCGVHADGIEVVAKVYANLSGVAKAMKRVGSVQNETDLRDFFMGFTQCMAPFDFIDVGQGKERADSKIKEVARWHLANYNCRQVVLGVSHDAGFAPFLDEILRDEQTKDLVTILEGFPTVRELLSTNVNIVNFTDTLFRTDKLVVGLKSSPPGFSAASPPPSSATPGAPSYAGVITATSASPPPTLNLPLAAKQTNTANRVSKQPPWNPGPRGMDKAINVNQTALDGIKKRKDNNKLCNNHYLRPPCAKGDACCFEHNYEVTAQERVAVAYLARLNPCTNGQECDITNCIYGHHCPSTINNQCQHPYCKFRPDEHPPATKYKSTYRNGDSYDT